MDETAKGQANIDEVSRQIAATVTALDAAPASNPGLVEHLRKRETQLREEKLLLLRQGLGPDRDNATDVSFSTVKSAQFQSILDSLGVVLESETESETELESAGAGGQQGHPAPWDAVEFNWDGRQEVQGTPDLLRHLERQLKAAGTPCGRGGYAVRDVHSTELDLQLPVGGVARAHGRTDGVIVPFSLDALSFLRQIRAVVKIKKSGMNASATQQGALELLAATCASKYRVMLLVTDGGACNRVMTFGGPPGTSRARGISVVSSAVMPWRATVERLAGHLRTMSADPFSDPPDSDNDGAGDGASGADGPGDGGPRKRLRLAAGVGGPSALAEQLDAAEALAGGSGAPTAAALAKLRAELLVPWLRSAAEALANDGDSARVCGPALAAAVGPSLARMSAADGP